MSNMNTQDGSDKFILPVEISSNGIVTHELETQDTYVDRNILVQITTPDAEFEVKDSGTLTATASTTDTTYTSDTATAYPIVIAADAHITDVTTGVKTAGFAASTDTVTISASDATQNTKTIYVKAGTLSGSGEASAESTNVALTKVSAKPSSGFYVEAKAAGSVTVSTAGWLEKDASAEANGDAFYSVQEAALNNAQTTGKTYTTKNAPILVSGSGLYINEGYIGNTYIPLADLVPDEANVKAGTDGNSNLIYNTVSVYDKDGALITGTMGDAALSDITADDAAATVATVAVAANDDSTAFKVTGSQAISGTASVDTATTGYAVAGTTKKSGTVSGTATVDATIAKVGVAVDITNSSLTVTPVIAKNDATTAKSSAISTTAPTSGYYVAVDAAAISASTAVAPKVATEGYGTTSVYNHTDGTVTAGTNASGVYYVGIDSASHSVTKSASEIVAPVTTVTTAVDGGDVTAVTVGEAAKVSGTKYVKIEANATTANGSVQTNATCTSTEGYITASTQNIVTKETVTVANASATAAFIKVYGGEYLDNVQ